MVSDLFPRVIAERKRLKLAVFIHFIQVAFTIRNGPAGIIFTSENGDTRHSFKLQYRRIDNGIMPETAPVIPVYACLSGKPDTIVLVGRDTGYMSDLSDT